MKIINNLYITDWMAMINARDPSIIIVLTFECYDLITNFHEFIL